MEKIPQEEEFIVTARKWRPQKFKDVVGQEHITTTLQNAIKSGRIHHAYLFSGPRGVGKTTTARILARAMNCTNLIDFEPCNQCDSCKAVLDGRSMDIIEIDGASNNSVDDIRKLRENAKYPPISGTYKMYIIDEVHMLSTSAFNALLKTLEEPPPHLMFVFATTEQHKVPATILSRCQRFNFRRMELDVLVRQLGFIAHQENIKIDETSLVTIAKKGDGSMRDSQSLFDQVTAFCGMDIQYQDMAEALHLIDIDFFFRISNAIKEKNSAEMFTISREVINKGYDLQECLHGLLEHFRNILTVKVTGSSSMIETSSNYLDKYDDEAKRFSKADLLRIMTIITNTDNALRFAPQPRIRFETALVQMSSIDSSVDLGELIDELKNLKTDIPSSLPVSQHHKQTNVSTTEPLKIKEDKPVYQAPVNISAKPTPKSSSSYDSNDEYLAKLLQSEPEKKVSTSKPVDAESIRSYWDKFVKNYGNSDNNLYLLKQKDLYKVTFLNAEIVITAYDSYTKNNLESNRQKLKDLLYEYFNNQIDVQIEFDENTNNSDSVLSEKKNYNLVEEHIKPEISSVLDSNNNKISIEEVDNNNIIIEESPKMRNKHPIEKKLMTDFDALEIQ